MFQPTLFIGTEFSISCNFHLSGAIIFFFQPFPNKKIIRRSLAIQKSKEGAFGPRAEWSPFSESGISIYPDHGSKSWLQRHIQDLRYHDFIS